MATGIDAPLPPRKPTLRPAKARTLKAFSRLNEIVDFIAAYKAANPEPFVVEVDKASYASDEFDITLDWSNAAQPPVGQVSLLAGEVLYHARTALDYLIYELSYLDSGTLRRKEKTAFPIITGHPKEFEGLKGRYLAGLSAEHIKVIKEYQPFNGVGWAARLQELSNTDKHREVTELTREFVGEFNFSPENMEPHPTDPAKLRARVGAPDALIVLPDGTPVVQGLFEIVEAVARILERFQVDFGEKDTLTVANHPAPGW